MQHGADAPLPSREELRARLRSKVGAKRNARVGGGRGDAAPSSMASAEQAALALAGDDPQLLAAAQSALRDPQGAKRMLQTLIQPPRAPPTLEAEEEEAPPPAS